MQDVRQWRTPVPRSVFWVQRLIWVAAALMVLPNFKPLAHDVSQPNFMLSAEDAQESHEFIHARIDKAREMGAQYSALDFAQDQRALVGLRNAMYDHGGEQAKGIAKRCDAMQHKLYDIAKSNVMAAYEAPEGSAHGGDARSAYATAMIDGALNAQLMAVSKIPRPSFLSELPPKEFQPTWRGFFAGWGMAWLATLPLAFLGVFLRGRAAGWSMREELVLRPWSPVLSSILWWYGLYNYGEGNSAVQDAYSKLRWRFFAEHRRWPEAHEEAELLRIARGPVTLTEERLESLARAAEHIPVKSRRAVMTAWMVGILSGPVHAVTLATTALAQAVRVAKPTPAAVDTTERRRSGDLGVASAGQADSTLVHGVLPSHARIWGFWIGEAGPERTRLATARLRAKSEGGGFSFTSEADLLRPRVVQLEAGRDFGPVSVSAGRILSPGAYDFSPPFKILAPASPVDDLLPAFYDHGASAAVSIGGTTLQTAVMNGEGPDDSSNEDQCVDGLARVEQRIGPMSVAGAWQHEFGGQRDYRAAFATLATTIRSIGIGAAFGYARRHDPRRVAAHLRADITVGETRAGIQLERPQGVTVSVERHLGALNRIGFHAVARDRHPPVWQLRFQQAVSFVQ